MTADEHDHPAASAEREPTEIYPFSSGYPQQAGTAQGPLPDWQAADQPLPELPVMEQLPDPEALPDPGYPPMPATPPPVASQPPPARPPWPASATPLPEPSRADTSPDRVDGCQDAARARLADVTARRLADGLDAAPLDPAAARASDPAALLDPAASLDPAAGRDGAFERIPPARTVGPFAAAGGAVRPWGGASRRSRPGRRGRVTRPSGRLTCSRPGPRTRTRRPGRRRRRPRCAVRRCHGRRCAWAPTSPSRPRCRQPRRAQRRRAAPPPRRQAPRPGQRGAAAAVSAGAAARRPGGAARVRAGRGPVAAPDRRHAHLRPAASRQAGDARRRLAADRLPRDRGTGPRRRIGRQHAPSPTGRPGAGAGRGRALTGSRC